MIFETVKMMIFFFQRTKILIFKNCCLFFFVGLNNFKTFTNIVSNAFSLEDEAVAILIKECFVITDNGSDMKSAFDKTTLRI